MPQYATVPPDGAPQPARCDDTPYAPAPARLPDGETWTADILALAEEAHRPLVIVDVGDGAAVPDGALFMRVRQGDDIGAQVDAELDRNGAAGSPIVLVGAGVYGCKAYLIADYLLHHGHPHVAWLRDGEEGIARSRIRHHDHRLL